MAKCYVTSTLAGKRNFIIPCTSDNKCSKLFAENVCLIQVLCNNILKTCLKKEDDHYLVVSPFVVETDNGECLQVKRGEILKAFTVSSYMIRSIVSEGDSLEKWSTIAYTRSKKGVIRKIRVPFSGTVVLVYSDPTVRPEKYVFFIRESKEVSSNNG